MQDITLIVPQVIKTFKKNPNRSISAVFRKYRDNPCYSAIGDIPILITITNTMKQIGINPSRWQTLYTLKQIEEVKSWSKKMKMDLLEELFKPSPVATKPLKNDPGAVEKILSTDLSIK